MVFFDFGFFSCSLTEDSSLSLSSSESESTSVPVLFFSFIFVTTVTKNWKTEYTKKWENDIRINGIAKNKKTENEDVKVQ